MVNKVKDFIERLEELTAQPDPALACLVAEMRDVLGDWQPHELRNLTVVRHEVAEGMMQNIPATFILDGGNRSCV